MMNIRRGKVKGKPGAGISSFSKSTKVTERPVVINSAYAFT